MHDTSRGQSKNSNPLLSAGGTSSKLDFWVITVHNRRAAILGTRKAYRHDGKNNRTFQSQIIMCVAGKRTEKEERSRIICKDTNTRKDTRLYADLLHVYCA